MKKVLFVMHTLGFGGAERSLVNLLHELPEGQYQVDILLFQRKGELIRQLPPWVRVLETPRELNSLYAPMRKAGALLPVKVLGTVCGRLLRRTKKAQVAYRWKHFYSRYIPVLQEPYDVAAAYGGAELMYIVADRVQAKRKLVWIHNDYRTGKYSAEDDRPYLASMDAVISVSNGCVDVLREIFPEISHKLHCVENITSSVLLRSRAEEFVPEQYSASVPCFLSVGRLWEQKGFDMAIDAAALLKESGVRFHWYVLGEGHLRRSLEEQIRSNGVEDVFFLLGTHSNPYPFMKHCTALIQPSRYEGKSVVLDEAKILQVPIIATAYPTVKDQINDGAEGMITPMSAQGIAAGIRTFLQDEVLQNRIRAYLASHEYGNSAECEKYRKLLDM